VAQALEARAMLRVSEGKLDEAWQDLLVCHRLGRLIARGATGIEALVGISIDGMASSADLSYLERAKLTSAQIGDRLKDLKTLPPMPQLADKIEFGERFLMLDGLQLVRRGDKPEDEIRMALIDFEPALRSANRWYDRMAAALRLKDRDAREKELDAIEQELEKIAKGVAARKKARDDMSALAKLLSKPPTPSMIGQDIGDVMTGLLVLAMRKVQNVHDRTEQTHRNLHVAFALGAYHRDNGRYPAKLDDLAPKYLAAVPNDIFSGKPIVYRPAEKGYLLYSVGVNGEDEEGRSRDADPPGDDLPVRMPLPELKPKK
jgi:hypothetical protein